MNAPPLDSLLLLSDGAGRIGRVPVGILGESTSIPDGRADRAAFREWANQLTIVGPVYAVAEDWIIPLVSVGHQEDAVDLLFLPHGSTPVLVHDAPIVVGTDSSAGEVVFDDPERLEPQYLRTARIRRRNG